MNKPRNRIAAAIISTVCVLIPSLAFASFDTNLSYGASGSAVLSLQQFLSGQGLLPASDDTGNFLSLTRSAVQQFQTQEGTIPATGFFGPLTRAKVNELMGNGTSVSSQATASNGSLPLIAQLQAQLQALLVQIATITGSSNTSVSSSNNPSATFTASPTSGTAPLTVTFTSNSSGTINFGDSQTSGMVFNDAVYQATHTYASAGTYTAQLMSDPCAGQTGACNVTAVLLGTVTITVTGPTQNATFTASPTSGTAPLTVTFTSNSSGTINFGDSQTSGMVFNDAVYQATHTYASAGTYTATLTNASGITLGTVTITVAGGTNSSGSGSVIQAQ